jgi:hypothetical protein
MFVRWERRDFSLLAPLNTPDKALREVTWNIQKMKPSREWEPLNCIKNLFVHEGGVGGMTKKLCESAVSTFSSPSPSLHLAALNTPTQYVLSIVRSFSLTLKVDRYDSTIVSKMRTNCKNSLMRVLSKETLTLWYPANGWEGGREVKKL